MHVWRSPFDYLCRHFMRDCSSNMAICLHRTILTLIQTTTSRAITIDTEHGLPASAAAHPFSKSRD